MSNDVDKMLNGSLVLRIRAMASVLQDMHKERDALMDSLSAEADKFLKAEAGRVTAVEESRYAKSELGRLRSENSAAHDRVLKAERERDAALNASKVRDGEIVKRLLSWGATKVWKVVEFQTEGFSVSSANASAQMRELKSFVKNIRVTEGAGGRSAWPEGERKDITALGQPVPMAAGEPWNQTPTWKEVRSHEAFVTEATLSDLRERVEALESPERKLSHEETIDRLGRIAESMSQQINMLEIEALSGRVQELLENNSKLVQEKRDLSIRAHVTQFHELAGQVNPTKPTVPSDNVVRHRARLMAEEFVEVLRAMFGACKAEPWHWDNLTRELAYIIEFATIRVDMVELADGLGDLDFVSEGTRLEFGINGGPIAKAISMSNNAKFPGGVVTLHPDTGKIMKPDGWEPPKIHELLLAQGWSGKDGTT